MRTVEEIQSCTNTHVLCAWLGFYKGLLANERNVRNYYKQVTSSPCCKRDMESYQGSLRAIVYIEGKIRSIEGRLKELA